MGHGYPKVVIVGSFKLGLGNRIGVANTYYLNDRIFLGGLFSSLDWEATMTVDNRAMSGAYSYTGSAVTVPTSGNAPNATADGTDLEWAVRVATQSKVGAYSGPTPYTLLQAEAAASAEFPGLINSVVAHNLTITISGELSFLDLTVLKTTHVVDGASYSSVSSRPYTGDLNGYRGLWTLSSVAILGQEYLINKGTLRFNEADRDKLRIMS